jgi:hypothetical protein
LDHKGIRLAANLADKISEVDPRTLEKTPGFCRRPTGRIIETPPESLPTNEKKSEKSFDTA